MHSAAPAPRLSPAPRRPRARRARAGAGGRAPAAASATTAEAPPPPPPSPAAAKASASAARRAAGLAGYASLKAALLRNTASAGALLTGYLALSGLAAPPDAASGFGPLSAAASAAAGAAGSLAYLAALCADVDAFPRSPGRPAPPPPRPRPGGAPSKQQQPGRSPLAALRAVADVYATALLRPQLGVVVALGVAACAWNDLAASDPSLLPARLQLPYLLLGLLSYKAAVLDQAVGALKAVTVYAAPDRGRPTLAALPELDPEDDPLAAKPAGRGTAQGGGGEEGGGGGGRRRAVSLGLAAALALAAAGGAGVAGAGPAGAAPSAAACARQCVAECTKVAPGSPAYCADACADACAPGAADRAGDAEGEGA